MTQSTNKIFGICSVEYEMSFKFFKSFESAFKYLKENYKYNGENYVRFDGLECGIIEYQLND